MHRLVALGLVCVALASGCRRYVRGELDYVRYPELQEASIYDERVQICGLPLGRIELIRVGEVDCSELAAAAVRDLIAEARAKGADGVRDVQFRGHYRWKPTIFCRHGVTGNNKVRVVGFAYKKCDVSSPEVQRQPRYDPDTGRPLNAAP